MNRITLISISIVVLSGLVGASPFILDQQTVNFQNNNFNTSASIINNTGNNTTLGLNADANLDFGDIPQGSNATKFINMSSDRKSILKMESEGNISNYLEYEDLMYFEGNRRIELEMKGRDPGNYTGNVSLSFEIPESRLGQRWLDLKYWVYKKL